MTPAELLERLKSVAFEAEVVASTPNILRRILSRRVEIRELGKAYDSGCLPDDQIRNFVDDLLRAGAGNERFPYQTGLAAIATMLEPRFTKFAEEYLSDLARIRSERFSIASRVARECLAARKQTTGTDVRAFPALTEIVTTIKWMEPLDLDNDRTAARVSNVWNSFQVA